MAYIGETITRTREYNDKNYNDAIDHILDKDKRVREMIDLEQREEKISSFSLTKTSGFNSRSSNSRSTAKDDEFNMEFPKSNTQDDLDKEDEEITKKQKQEVLILQMNSPMYNLICMRVGMQQRTLINNDDVTDKIIKEDSVQI